MKFTASELKLLKDKEEGIAQMASSTNVSLKIMQEEVIVISRIKRDLETLIENSMTTPNSGGYVSNILRSLFVRLHFLLEANSLQFLFDVAEVIRTSTEACINETMTPADQMELMINSFYEQLEEDNNEI